MTYVVVYYCLGAIVLLGPIVLCGAERSNRVAEVSKAAAAASSWPLLAGFVFAIWTLWPLFFAQAWTRGIRAAREYHEQVEAVQKVIDDSSHRLEHSRQVVTNVHAPEQCAGRPCPIHNPSDHHMRSFPQHWRDDRGLMERICPHGVGHPDPDGLESHGVHGCDGCCRKPEAA